ncbi:YtkA-like [Lentzea xinjiangensis]|uniref:YtkA-like n=1 Tax=Lentzea xinjiangensis TaxID=402600 RepID=A0A1H9JT38_9PSEU|nr:FixH family protein [Lentzea xinjiangensis]SEQ89989.1 YtkA-like [Lentzea xinjiangensis]
MKRNVVLALAGVVAVLAALVVLWPRGVEARPQLAESDRFRFVLTPASTRSGSNSFDLRVTDRAGNAARGEVTVEPAMPRMGHAVAPITAAELGPGHYRAGGVDLFMAGQWEITVSFSAERVVIPLLLT